MPSMKRSASGPINHLQNLSMILPFFENTPSAKRDHDGAITYIKNWSFENTPSAKRGDHGPITNRYNRRRRICVFPSSSAKRGHRGLRPRRRKRKYHRPLHANTPSAKRKYHRARRHRRNRRYKPRCFFVPGRRGYRGTRGHTRRPGHRRENNFYWIGSPPSIQSGLRIQDIEKMLDTISFS